MAYPQTPIITAFIAALSTPQLVTDSITYDVFTTVQRGENQYVLLSQPTLTSGSGSSDCETWDATVLLSVFTRYALNAAVNFDQTLAIGTAIAERLVKQRLPLNGFGMSPIDLVLAETRQTANETGITVQHTLRLRFEVYEGDSPVVPPVVPIQKKRLISKFTPNTGDVAVIEIDEDMAASYIGYSVTGGEVSVTLTLGFATIPFDTGDEVGLSSGNYLTVSRVSGNPTITFTEK